MSPPSASGSFSWSSLHISKISRAPPPSASPAKPRARAHPPTPAPAPPVMSISNDPGPSSSRSSSLAGRKRPRESDEHGKPKPKPARRTKSLGDSHGNGREGKAKDREAFQRGLIAVFVPNALQESTRGNLAHYNDLLSHFLPTPTSPYPALPPLLPLLRSISAHVSLLSPDIHGALVSAILSLSWANGEDKFVKTFVGFCGVLVTAQPSWAKEVVSMAVQGLAWQRPRPSTVAAAPITRRLYHARHHLLLSHLLSLIPTLPNVLGPLLVRHFPHKREAEVAQTTWVRNSCELIGYCPELGQRVWGEIVDRMLRIDVEITQRAEDDEDEDDEDDDESVAGPSQLAIPRPDPFDLLVTEDIPVDPSLVPPSSESDDDDSDGDPDPDELSSVDGDASDGEGPPSAAKEALERERKRIALKAMRAKLDGMLCSFFEHLEECMGGRVEHPPAAELAAATLTAASSGTSTPTSEIPTPLSSAPSLVARRPPPTPAQSLAHFQTLLNLFSRQILPTSSTQHIPFLLFLTSSFSPAHTDLFLGLLVSQALYATSTTAPTLNSQPISIGQRVAATVYIGSVVCRARFVTDDQARQVITYLLAWIEGKLHQTRTTRQTDELPLFYAVCQAVMLIFCFRWRAFTGTNPEHEGVLGEMELETEGESVEDGEAGGSGGDGKWMRDLDVLQRAITSELNPLLGCNPTIVSMFAKVAHQTGFAYCFSIIEANTSAARSTSSHALNRVASASTSAPSQGQSTTNSGTAFSSSASISASASDRESGRGRVNSVAAAASAGSASVTLPRQARQTNVDSGLDSYFPFDPYDLVRSNRWIESKYRTWDEVAMGADSDDEDDDDDEEDESEDEEEDVSEDSELENRLGSGLGGNKTSLPKAMTMPKSTPSSWDRRRWLKDNGLSSSLEGMSISPNVSGFAR